MKIANNERDFGTEPRTDAAAFHVAGGCCAASASDKQRRLDRAKPGIRLRPDR
jgi:hypothetical protein